MSNPSSNSRLSELLDYWSTWNQAKHPGITERAGDQAAREIAQLAKAEIKRLQAANDFQRKLLNAYPDEQKRLQGEIERLRGIQPELPPMPPAGKGLPRYGIRWNGPQSP